MCNERLEDPEALEGGVWRCSGYEVEDVAMFECRGSRGDDHPLIDMPGGLISQGLVDAKIRVPRGLQVVPRW